MRFVALVARAACHGWQAIGVYSWGLSLALDGRPSRIVWIARLYDGSGAIGADNGLLGGRATGSERAAMPADARIAADKVVNLSVRAWIAALAGALPALLAGAARWTAPVPSVWEAKVDSAIWDAAGQVVENQLLYADVTLPDGRSSRIVIDDAGHVAGVVSGEVTAAEAQAVVSQVYEEGKGAE